MTVSTSVRRMLNEQDECHLFLTGDCQGKNGMRCSSELEIDHIYPRSKGGEDSVRNCKKVCKDYNRMKSDKLDSRYTQLNDFFDQLDEDLLAEIYPNLRISQQEMLGRFFVADFQSFIVKNYGKLLNHILLIVAETGLGKSLMLILLILLMNKIMREDNLNSYRPNKTAMILVPERAIADQLANEYKGYHNGRKKVPSELISILGLKVVPKVLIVDSSSELTPNIVRRYDIVICCQQALWSTQSNNRGLSESEMRNLFNSIDILAVDECQIAPSQLREIALNAPNCLKFHFTATPYNNEMVFFPDQNRGEFKDLYKLVAVAQSCPDDKSHKELKPLFKKGYEDLAKQLLKKEIIPINRLKEGLESSYVIINGGESSLQKGENNIEEVDTLCRANKPRLLRSIEVSKSMVSENGQILIVCDTVKQVKAVDKIINEWAEENKTPEWGSVYSIGGSSMLHTNPKNPINLTKENGGIPTPKSKRILVVDELGKIGFNNPLFEVLNQFAIEKSAVAVTQRIGRIIRRNDKINMAIGTDKQKKQIAKIVWDSAADPNQDFLRVLYNVINYINEMSQICKEKFDDITTVSPDFSFSIVKNIEPTPITREKQNQLTEKVYRIITNNPDADIDWIVEKTIEGEELTNGRKTWTINWLNEKVTPSVFIGIENKDKKEDYIDYLTKNVEDDITSIESPSVPSSEDENKQKIITKNNDVWVIPEIMIPVTYCYKELIPTPTISELIEFVNNLKIDPVTKDNLIQRISSKDKGTVDFYANQYIQNSRVINSQVICGYDPHALLGVKNKKDIPKEIENYTILSELEKELKSVYVQTVPNLSTFYKELRISLYIASAVVFGLKGFGESASRTYKEKKNEIAFAMISDPRKENVSGKIFKIAKAVFIKRSYVNHGALEGLYIANKQQIDWLSFCAEKQYQVLKNGKK